MTRFFIAIALLLGAMRLGAYGVRDFSGREFEFEAPPRAVTVVPSVTETVFLIGAGERLLGVSRYCSYPESLASSPEGAAVRDAIAGRPKLGGFVDPDYEKILSLRPDIAVLPATSDSTVRDKLERIGIPVFLVEPDGLDSIAANTRLLGRLFRCEGRAEEVARRVESAIAPAAPGEREAWGDISLKSPDASGRPPRAIFMFGKMAAGENSFAGGLIVRKGLENVVGKDMAAWPVPSREFVLSSAPEVLIIQADTVADFEGLRKSYEGDPVWSKTPAVRNSRIYFVPTELVIRPSPTGATAPLPRLVPRDGKK